MHSLTNLGPGRLARAVMLILSLPAISALLAAQNPILPPAVERAVRDRLEMGVHVGMALGIVDSEGSHFFNFGPRSANSEEAVDPDTVFEIGSVSEVFTSILLAELVGQGALQLDQPIQTLLPEGVRVPTHGGHPIRLVDLATHSSGLPRLPDNLRPADVENPYADYSPQQMFDFLSRYQLTRDPGTQYDYSNYGAGLLGFLLARQAAPDYPTLVRTRIFEPLKMERTAVGFSPGMTSNLADGHRNGLPVKHWDIFTLAGAGGIRSTAREMLSFISANLSIPPNELGRAMELAQRSRMRVGRGMEVGLGWHIRAGNQGRPIIWHNGGTGGFRSFVGLDRESRLGVVILANSDQSVDDLGFYILDRSFPLDTIRPSIAAVISRLIREEGIEAARRRYSELKSSSPGQYDFGEGQLNSLGYQYLRAKQIDAALAVLELNLRSFPDSANAHDSAAEAYFEKGDITQAIVHYIEALKRDPDNPNAREKLRQMGMDPTHIGRP